MADFAKSVGRRDLGADIIHGLLNVTYAAAVVFLASSFNTPWPAIALVLLSKWRVVAVRPRYWWANFLSAIPDLTIGLGVVIIAWQAGQLGAAAILQGEALPVQPGVIQTILGVLYTIWLVVIKPMDSERMVACQALISQAVGLIAIFELSSTLPLLAVMALCFIVAFGAARQALNNFDEKDLNMLASIWGVMMLELAFVSWHWSVFYRITPILLVPQIAIIASAISIVVYRVYRAWQDDRRVTWDELGVPVVVTVILTLVVLFGLSGL